MAEVFTNSGENSNNVVVPPPQLQGIFLPGIDDTQKIDGFGVVTPFGGGSTVRKYFDYGISAEGPQQNTQLNDLSRINPTGGTTYNFEGLVGPQGPIGPPGPRGISSLSSLPYGYVLPANSNFLAALPHNIDQINALGTAADKMIYTDGFDTFTEFIWEESTPGGDAYSVDLSYTSTDSTKQGAASILQSWYQSFIPVTTITLTGLEINIDSIVSGTAKANIFFYNADADGKPVGAPLSGGSLGNLSTVNTGWQGDLSLSPNLTLTSGSRYCFRLQGNVTGGVFHFDFDSGDSYSDGTCWYWNGSDFVAQNGDINFKLYGSTQVGGTDKIWRAAASNSDGTRLIVGASSGRLWTSANSGTSWTERQPAGDIDDDWEQAASSSDGANLIVSSSLGRIYTSTDYGANWTERQPKGAGRGEWDAVDSDADGSHLIAGDFGPGRLWTSADSGASWTERRPSGNDLNYNWWAARSDSDGSNLIVAAGYNQLYTSANSGASWTNRQPIGNKSWIAVASDADGSHLVAIEGTNGRIYTSANSGASWTERRPAGDVNKDWSEVVSDSDGSHLMVAANSGRLYTSEDYGVTWTEERPAGDANKAWHAMASDSDGTNLIAGISSGRLYTGILSTLYSEATWAESELTSAGRAILDDADAATQATTLGLGVGDAVTHDTLTLSSIAAEGADVDKFLVDSAGVIKYRTGDQVLSDIGASAAAHLHDTQTLQHDAVNSDGGAFSFSTTGLVSFNQSIAAANYAAANLLTASATNAGEIDFTAASKKLDVEDNAVVSQDYSSNASPTWAGATLTGLTDDSLIYPASGVLTSLGVASNGQLPIGSTGTTPVLATISGTTDHIAVSNGVGSIALNFDTNTQILLGSFNGIFLEKLDFTISESGGTVTGTLEQADGGGDLTQRFSDGYTVLDCTPAKTIDLTAYVGTDAVPKEVFIYILQSAKTVIVVSNVDWPLDPEVEHIKIAHLVLKSAVTTGTDGGALMNQNHNDYAFDATGEGHLQDIEHRLRQEPAQYHSGVALTLKNAAGAALTTGNSSTAVELVTATGHIFQIHQHNFPAFDMYTVGTDKADIVNQPTDEGGAYETTVDLVTDITHYVDGTAAGVAIGVNKYFNLVVWGVMNKSGEVSFLMINLPTSQYTKSADAVADIDGSSIFEIPSAFKGTGFLIARLTFRLIGGSQWTYIAQEDLRGKVPDIIAGVGITTTDHALLANLDFASAGHTGFLASDGSVALAGAWDMGSQVLTNVNIDSGDIHNDVTHTQWDAGYSHSLLTSGNPHSVTPTELSLIIGTDTQAWDAGLDSLAALSYVAASFVKMTGANTFALRTLQETSDDLEATIDHDNLLNFTSNEHYLQSAITATGTIASGTWEATDVGIGYGGTGQSTAQLAINALTAVSGATNEHVLTKDTGTGNAVFKAVSGGGDVSKQFLEVVG